MEVYAIGDEVYIADMECVNDYEPCPVCYGKKEVIVILGNGDQVAVACGYCQQGIEPPRGAIQVGSHLISGCHRDTITGVDVRTHHGELDITYWFGCIGHGAEVVDKDRDKCLQKGTARAAQYSKDNRERKLDLAKHDVNKSYAWNAGYHMKQAERAKHDFEYHSAKARLLQEKAKEVKRDKSKGSGTVEK